MRVKVRILKTGEIKEVPRMDARIAVALKRAEYVEDEPASSNTYETRHLEAVQPAKRRGRPPGVKNVQCQTNKD